MGQSKNNSICASQVIRTLRKVTSEPAVTGKDGSHCFFPECWGHQKGWEAIPHPHEDVIEPARRGSQSEAPSGAIGVPQCHFIDLASLVISLQLSLWGNASLKDKRPNLKEVHLEGWGSSVLLTLPLSPLPGFSRTKCGSSETGLPVSSINLRRFVFEIRTP